jgi:hypothetical protein
MRASFDEDLKTTESLPMPKVNPPTKIIDAPNKVGLKNSDMVRAYIKLIINERLFEGHLCFWRN